MWRRNLDVVVGPEISEADEGVGERLYGSSGDIDPETKREREAPAGIGVETPSAFASLASR